MEKTTEKIVRLMKSNPYITNKELAEVCGITEDGVYWNIRKIKKEESHSPHRRRQGRLLGSDREWY